MVEKVNTKRNEGYNQVCVWPGTLLKKTEIPDLLDFFMKEMGTRVQFLETIKTAPDLDSNGNPTKGTGGRSDVFMAVHDEDVMKFAIPRLKLGIRWIEDVLDNEHGFSIYPNRVGGYRHSEVGEDEPKAKKLEGPITQVKVKLVGEDDNAFSILGRVGKAMRRAGVSKDVIDAYQKEATAGDYSHLLATTMKYVIVDGDDDDEEGE